jgi:hypothetical protein
MNFAERLLSSQVETIQRTPREGDLVVSDNPAYGQHLWLVEEVRRDVWGRRIDFIGVVDYVHQGRPNVFYPREVKVVSAAEAKDARAYYAMVEGA